MFDKKKILSIAGHFSTDVFCSAESCELYAAPKKHIIVIDPAHGGQDKGIGLTNDVSEKDITLAVALSVQKELSKENNLEVILTRDSDKEVSLEDRKKNIAKIKPDFVLSLHANAGFGKSAAGFELYYQELNKDGIKGKKTAKDDALQGKNKCLNDSVGYGKNYSGKLEYFISAKGQGHAEG